MIIITHICYLLTGVLVLVGLISSLFGAPLPLNMYHIFLLLLLSLPAIDFLGESILKDTETSSPPISKGVHFQNGVLLLLIGLCCYFLDVSLVNIHIILFALFSALYRVDPRFSFLGALVLIFLTLCTFQIKPNNISEAFSISAYYLLIIGVILEIKNHIFSTKEITTEDTHSESLFFVGEVKELFNEYIQLGYKKIADTKVSILKEIGEYKKPEEPTFSDILTKKPKKIFSKESQDGIAIKLIKYFSKKYWVSLKNIVHFLFCFNVFFTVIGIYFSLWNILIFSFYIFLLHYIIAKYKGEKFSFDLEKKYIPKILQNTDEQSGEQTRFFMQKANLFGSVGLLSSYALFTHMNISHSGGVYIGIFLVFFCAYYLYFSVIGTIIGKYLYKLAIYLLGGLTGIFQYNYGAFILRNIYMFLSLFLISSILIFLGIKEGIFKQWYIDYKESQGYENFVVIPDTPKQLTTEELRELGEEFSPDNLGIISDEVQIGEESTSGNINGLGSTAENSSASESISVDNSEKTSVRNLYRFTQQLQLNSQGEQVKNLEIVMRQSGYFGNTPDTFFDQETKEALTRLLRTECDWPESTRGMLGAQARECVYSLEIARPVEENN